MLSQSEAKNEGADGKYMAACVGTGKTKMLTRVSMKRMSRSEGMRGMKKLFYQWLLILKTHESIVLYYII